MFSFSSAGAAPPRAPGRTTTNNFNRMRHPYHGSYDCRSNFSSLARLVNEQLQDQSTFYEALRQIDNCAENREASRPTHNEAHAKAITLVRNLYQMVEYALSETQYIRFALSFRERPMTFTLICTRRNGRTDTFKADVTKFERIASSRRNSTRRQRKQRRTRKNTRN